MWSPVQKKKRKEKKPGGEAICYRCFFIVLFLYKKHRKTLTGFDFFLFNKNGTTPAFFQFDRLLWAFSQPHTLTDWVVVFSGCAVFPDINISWFAQQFPTHGHPGRFQVVVYKLLQNIIAILYIFVSGHFHFLWIYFQKRGCEASLS